MRTPWTEFALKIAMLFTVISFILYDQEQIDLPIIEIALALIVSAQLMAITKSDWISERKTGSLLRQLEILVIRAIVLGQVVLFSVFLPYFFCFMSVFTFDYYISKISDIILLAVTLFLLGSVIGVPITLILAITGVSILTAYLHTSFQKAKAFQTAAYQEIDQLSAVNHRFRLEQQQLIAVQDQQSEEQVRLERKRIVDEIHDILGHQLSSAVIQIGALEYIVQEDQAKQGLGQVKDVLNTSMANIRAVIHAEHASTIQLDWELNRIVEDFTKAPIQFTYQNTRPLTNQDAHSILNIVREGFTNINKHSNASKVQLRFIENIDNWTLLLADNGQGLEPKASGGIGLMNMEERVQQLGGKIHISTNNGFRIFITIPFKEVINHENTISR
ncbi:MULTISPECIES: sensor histidine kinase [Aerococcus]|uniref:sensor histidine kinase n=1 Tax=Aerococcus TaxID=1375 RepID=UPI003AD78DEE